MVSQNLLWANREACEKHDTKEKQFKPQIYKQVRTKTMSNSENN